MASLAIIVIAAMSFVIIAAGNSPRPLDLLGLFTAGFLILFLAVIAAIFFLLVFIAVIREWVSNQLEVGYAQFVTLRPKNSRTPLIAISVVILLVIVGAAFAYILTPPNTVTVSGTVNVQSASEVEFDTITHVVYTATVYAGGSYSISLPNQQTYYVAVWWISQSVPRISICGTLTLYQSTKLGPYSFNIDASQCK